jgi:hypothetical protein
MRDISQSGSGIIGYVARRSGARQIAGDEYELRRGAYDGAREHIARTTVAPTKLKKFVIEERH